jgi:hypothetical protein
MTAEAEALTEGLGEAGVEADVEAELLVLLGFVVPWDVQLAAKRLQSKAIAIG